MNCDAGAAREKTRDANGSTVTSRVHLLTFGAGYEGIRSAARRLVSQGLSCGYFDECVAMCEADLESDFDFQERHAEFVRANARGYGYWIWKSFLIGRYLETLPDGDILFFSDAGSEINPLAKNEFEKIVNHVRQNGNFFVSLNRRKCEDWSKADLMNKYPALRGREQIETSFIGFLASDFSRKLVAHWLAICCEENYRYLDDTPSHADNSPDFVENRHDQSCLSAVVYPSHTTVCDKLFYGRRKIVTPILPLRNRTGRQQAHAFKFGPIGFLALLRPGRRPKVWMRLLPPSA
jgi:hypothetical protein